MDLKQIYRDYTECLNEQAWLRLGKFVAEEVVHNNNPLGLSGYREMLEHDYAAVPDLRFNVEMMISEYPYLGKSATVRLLSNRRLSRLASKRQASFFSRERFLRIR